MPATGTNSPLAFLAVFSEPGDLVSQDEFQDWYNNEHVPLRLNHLHSFLTGARYSATDAAIPSWLAVYDIDSPSTFQHESYTRLRANRSPREADLVKRLDILDRRTCEVVLDSGETLKTSSFALTNPTPILVTHGVQFAENESGEVQKWFDSTSNRLKDINGWVRTRCFRCIDNLKSGRNISNTDQSVPRYIFVHEFLEESAVNRITDILPAKTDSQGSEVVEERKWQLYRAYPCLAQGNLPDESSTS